MSDGDGYEIEEPSNDSDRVARSSRLRRSFIPRFGLRALLIIAILFCAAFAWVGRGMVRVRQEDAAIEAIERAGGTIAFESASGSNESLAPSVAEETPNRDGLGRQLQRAIGWTKRPAIVGLAIRAYKSDDAGDVDAAIAALSTFRELRELVIHGETFDDATVDAIDRLPRLESLSLHYPEIDGERLSKLKSPERLRELCLVNRRSNSDFLIGLSAMTELRGLTIEFYRDLTRDDVAAIAALPKLERLDLWSVTPSEDEVYAPLSRARNLQNLSIVARDAFGFRESDLKAVAELPRLRELLLDGLTNENLAALEIPPGLRVLTMANGLEPANARTFEAQMDIPPEAVQRFSAEHPLCEVRCIQDDGVVRRYCFLGGEPIDRPPGWE